MPGGIDLTVVLAYTVGLIVIYLLFRLLWVPAKLALRCAYAMAIGLVVIGGLNLVGGYFDLHLPLNVFSVLTVGFLGVPGIVLVIAIGTLF